MVAAFNPTSGYNRTNPIPGVSGRRVPGTARMPKLSRSGGHLTQVPFMESSGGQAGSAIFREYHRQQVRDAKGRFAGGWGFAWQGLAAINDNLIAFDNTLHDNIHTAVQRIADEMVAYAKENAPWQDHPGENEDARENLQSAVVWQDDDHFTIMLGHGKDVYYGIWLEVRWGGKYAIILPTVEHFAPLISGAIVGAT